MLNKKKLYPFLFVLAGLLLGCVAPFQGQPTQSGLAPVDMTVTAVLKVLFTSTAADVSVVSATLPASATPEPAFTIQPSDTTAPTTPTPADTETPEPARIRSGPSLVVVFLDQPPILDGIWDEWTTTSYTATNLVYGAAQMTGRNDLGASFRVGWDNKYLYLAVKVGDDSYVQRDTLANIYNGDSIEISLDTELQADFESSQLNSDDYQVRISPGNPDPGKHPEAYLWFPRNISTSLSQVKIGAVGGQDLYRLEAAVPWSVFDIIPQPGMHFGFVLRVNDDDEVELNIQQSAVASVKGASPADPTTWGDFVLEK